MVWDQAYLCKYKRVGRKRQDFLTLEFRSFSASLIVIMKICLGVIQQLRGQEEGEGGQPKVHACPPRGGAQCFHMEVKVAVLNAISLSCS